MTNTAEATSPAREPRVLTVLIAEDDAALRTLTARSLELDGYRVLVAADGQAALDAAAAHGGPLHLLLADLMLPRLSGPALCDALRAQHPGLKVLFMSGYGPEMAAAQGANDERCFLAKPFMPGDLTDKVRALLDNTPANGA